MKKLKKYLSPLTVTGGLFIIGHVLLLIFDYQTLANGEGWGVVYVIGVLFWSSIMIGVGLLIKLIFKNKRIAIVLDSIILFSLLINVILKYT